MNRKTDAQLQREVLRELRWDTRIGGTEIGVAVSDGVVALTGAVTSYAKKMAAQTAAHRVGGVLDVANDIRVTRQYYRLPVNGAALPGMPV